MAWYARHSHVNTEKSTKNFKGRSPLVTAGTNRTPLTMRACRSLKLDLTGLIGHRGPKIRDHLCDVGFCSLGALPVWRRYATLTCLDRQGFNPSREGAFGEPPRHCIKCELRFGVVEVRPGLPVNNAHTSPIGEHGIHAPTQHHPLCRLNRDVNLGANEPVGWKNLETLVEFLDLRGDSSELRRFQRQGSHRRAQVRTCLFPAHIRELLRWNGSLYEMSGKDPVRKTSPEHCLRRRRKYAR